MDLAVCRQVIGTDFHASAIVGGDNLKADGADFGIDTAWAQTQTEHQPKGTAHSGHPLEPAAIAFNSQHVRGTIQLLCSLHQFASIRKIHHPWLLVVLCSICPKALLCVSFLIPVRCLYGKTQWQLLTNSTSPNNMVLMQWWM